MPINTAAFSTILNELRSINATLVAVSKTKPAEDIQSLYELGHRDFGENYVQELIIKQSTLPKDIRWHFIGHLQSNKIKMIAPFVYLIHGVDSLRLLEAIEKEGRKLDRNINCLLQVHIANEETKFGFDTKEVTQVASALYEENKFSHIRLCGLMGMASFTNDLEQVRKEFQSLKSCFDQIRHTFPAPDFKILSMGMSGDYKIALDCGSNMVRIGSMLFGTRN